MTWKVIHSSVIGKSHVREEKPCQDYANYYTDGQRLIGVVADGASSAKYSDEGAKIAVNSTIQHIKQRFKTSNIQCPIKDQYTANQFFIDILQFVKIQLEKKAKIHKYSIKELACTLLVFITHRNWLTAMQIGDGLIVIREKNRVNYQLIFKPDKGEYANQTTFLTSSNATDDMQVYFNFMHLDFICATTDWCENIAVTKLQKWQPLTDFFKPLEDCIRNQEQKTSQAEIDDLLNSARVNQETDDDKTLLLCSQYQHKTNKNPYNTSNDPGGKIIPPNIRTHSNAIKRLQKSFSILFGLFLISFGFNFILVFIIHHQRHPIQHQHHQNAIPTFVINKSDETPIDISLNAPQFISYVWVKTSIDSINQETKTITANKNNLIYLEDKQRTVGVLPPGTYPFIEAEYFQGQKNKNRLVKLKINIILPD